MDYFSHKFTEYNNKCYFMAKKFNGIYMLDLENGKTSFFGMVPGEPSMGNLKRSCVLIINYLLFQIKHLLFMY